MQSNLRIPGVCAKMLQLIAEMQRNSFRSLPAKTLLRCKIAANVRKHQYGTVFATGDARTVVSFRNRAHLPVKGGQAVQGLSPRNLSAAKAPINAVEVPAAFSRILGVRVGPATERRRAERRWAEFPVGFCEEDEQ